MLIHWFDRLVLSKEVELFFYYFSVSRIFRSFKQRVEIGFRYLVHTFYMYKAMHISANHFDLLQFNAKCVSNPKRDSPQEMSIITLKGPPNIPKLKANSYILHIY